MRVEDEYVGWVMDGWMDRVVCESNPIRSVQVSS